MDRRGIRMVYLIFTMTWSLGAFNVSPAGISKEHISLALRQGFLLT
jgi:hypothetical protein